MTNDRFLPFAFPAVASKKITAAFDGRRMTSDGGVMVLAQAARRLTLADAAVKDKSRLYRSHSLIVCATLKFRQP